MQSHRGPNYRDPRHLREILTASAVYDLAIRRLISQTASLHLRVDIDGYRKTSRFAARFDDRERFFMQDVTYDDHGTRTIRERETASLTDRVKPFRTSESKHLLLRWR